MSWDKNTVNVSEVDATVKVLNNVKIPYNITVLGEVEGDGWADGETKYKLRRLEYGNVVLLECMYRTHDCDSDDYLQSVEFPKDQEPKGWELEQYEPEPSDW